MRLRNAITAIAAAAALTASAAAPKYIFYYIGDGMGMGPVTAAEMYNRQVLGNELPITMMQFPVAGVALTYSDNSPVTDSAAAGTALSTGHKTKNGMLGMNPDSVEVFSLANALKADGYGVGVATSVAADDATPGAFYAHVPHRGMYYKIGEQAAHSGLDFLAGAGLRGPKGAEGEPTLYELMDQNDVQVVRGPGEIANISAQKVLLLNNEGSSANNIGFTIDSLDNTLTLPVITQACLDHLQRVSPKAFFMMVEGGNIDHALHGNDGGAAIKEILNFNQALDIAYQFYKAHPEETLIVVTADHDTGGLAIGNKTVGGKAKFGNIDYQRISKEGFNNFCRSLLESRRTFTWDDMKEYLADNLGFWKHIDISDKQEEALEEMYKETFIDRDAADEKTLYANFNGFVKEVFQVFNDNTGFGFITTSHTGNPVPVYAVGVGAQAFANLNNNSDIPGKIMEIVNSSK